MTNYILGRRLGNRQRTNVIASMNIFDRKNHKNRIAVSWYVLPLWNQALIPYNSCCVSSLGDAKRDSRPGQEKAIDTRGSVA
jgi:hypothetical protein